MASSPPDAVTVLGGGGALVSTWVSSHLVCASRVSPSNSMKKSVVDHSTCLSQMEPVRGAPPLPAVPPLPSVPLLPSTAPSARISCGLSLYLVLFTCAMTSNTFQQLPCVRRT